MTGETRRDWLPLSRVNFIIVNVYFWESARVYRLGDDFRGQTFVEDLIASKIITKSVPYHYYIDWNH